MKIERMIYIILASLLMMVGIYVMKTNVSAILTVNYVFTLVMGLYLGFDIANLIKDTKSLPIGEYKPIYKRRYIFAIIIFILMITETKILEFVFKVDLVGVYAPNFIGAMICLSLLVSGLQANRLYTDTTEKEEK